MDAHDKYELYQNGVDSPTLFINPTNNSEMGRGGTKFVFVRSGLL